ncbi:MAG: sphingomyelin phosphodiesterase [Bacteroidia bacterium]|nr:sphingomyelin phosphodiesterase [Bacteroidia bacterium]
MKKLIAFILLAGFCFSFGLYSQNDTVEGKTRLKILTWNIYMLPNLVKFTKKDERAKEIGELLKHSDYDVVVLQEAFRKKSKRIIRKALKKEYPYRIEPESKSLSLKAGSGIWILSKVKMKKKKDLSFKYCSGIPDCMARKGATMVEGEKNGKRFHLIGTHLQAEDKYPQTRKRQFRQIMKEMVEPFSQKNIPLIIAGDLNVNKYDSLQYRDMLGILDAEDGVLEGEIQSTFSGMYKNPGSLKRSEVLDYILLRKNGSKIFSMRRKAKWFKSHANAYNLSDHLGVEMEIEF